MFIFDVYSELREFSRNIMNAICCFMFAGPILIIAGAAVLAGATVDTRGDNLSKFNAAAAAWSSSGFAAFNNRTGYNVSSNMAFTSTLALAKSTTSDYYPDTSGANVPTQSVKFTANNDFTSPFAYFTFDSTTALNGYYQTLTIAQNSTGTSITDTVYLLRTNVISVSCSNSDSYSTCANRCPSNSFFQTKTVPTSKCYQYWKLSALCYVINPATNQLDTNGKGCLSVSGVYGGDYASKSWADEDSSWSRNIGAHRYTALTPPEPISGSTQIDFNSVPITIRSSADPYVTALRISGGSLSFGLTQAAKGFTGVALLAVGIIITLGACCTAYAVVRMCARSSNKPYSMSAGTATTVIQPVVMQPTMVPVYQQQTMMPVVGMPVTTQNPYGGPTMGYQAAAPTSMYPYNPGQMQPQQPMGYPPQPQQQQPMYPGQQPTGGYPGYPTY